MHENDEIENRYIKKVNMSFLYNYFSFILMMSAMGWISFLFEGKIVLIAIGIFPILFTIFLYFKKGEDIITSVGIYKYSEIFLEIMKSIMPKKKELKKVTKSLWKKKTASK